MADRDDRDIPFWISGYAAFCLLIGLGMFAGAVWVLVKASAAVSAWLGGGLGG